MKLPLEKARICLECDTIHDLPACPECGSTTFYYLARWVKPKQPPKPESEAEQVEQAPAPERPRKKSRHILRKVLFTGLGILGAYQLLFKPSRKKPPEE